MREASRRRKTGAEALRVLIAGGGTGGHLYPGIAVAREIMRRDPSSVVTFAGTRGGVESKVVPREGFELDLVRSGGLKGKSIPSLGRGIGLLPMSALDAWRVVRGRAPDLVVGLGGYSSGPVVLVAAAHGIPTLLLEQNAVPGLTNRLLARIVRAAAVTFESTLGFFGSKGFVSGNPVRPEFFEVGAAARMGEAAPGRPPSVLVFGGSQGAHAINMAMVEAAPALAAATTGLRVTHQTGERDLELVREAYRKAALEARVEPFLYHMAQEMAEADMVLCRAGATTLAEIAAAARPAILVPLPTATDDHQRKNAEVLEREGAAEVITQRALTGTLLAARVLALAADPERRARMAQAVHRLARPDAAALIVDRAMRLVSTPSRDEAAGSSGAAGQR
jgi:UDP-N-acetylglucosamine--N-acetylmuramyl-(pentapeptide) pyrophosphoryl-undecaprenol N-acetylglucosamine transferase